MNLKIRMKDGSMRMFREGEYTDYEMRKDYFIVRNGEQWVGCFAVDEFMFFTVDKYEMKNN